MDIEFRGVREKDGGLIMNFIADMAIRLADWLYAKFYDRALLYIMQYDLEQDDE
jgi:hypothetical protein